MARVLRFLIGFALLVWAAMRWGLGYIDPNTGGLLFQILAVLFAFSSAIILFFSRQIRSGIARFSRFMRRLFSH
jgi:hypothetical protein